MFTLRAFVFKALHFCRVVGIIKYSGISSVHVGCSALSLMSSSLCCVFYWWGGNEGRAATCRTCYHSFSATKI